MISKNTEVHINIDTLSVTEFETDRTSFTYDGTLYTKGDSVYVMYTDGEKCTIKQNAKSVRVLRHASKSCMVFESGETHPTVMNTPAGPMPITIDTLSIFGNLESELEIIYRIIYNNTVMTQNTVNIKIEEK